MSDDELLKETNTELKTKGLPEINNAQARVVIANWVRVCLPLLFSDDGNIPEDILKDEFRKAVTKSKQDGI